MGFPFVDCQWCMWLNLLQDNYNPKENCDYNAYNSNSNIFEKATCMKSLILWISILKFITILMLILMIQLVIIGWKWIHF
jgi:hypothetical protein